MIINSTNQIDNSFSDLSREIAFQQDPIIPSEIIRAIPALSQNECTSHSFGSSVNIQEVHIHYYSEKNEGSPAREKDSSSLVRKAIQKSKNFFGFSSPPSTSAEKAEGQTECSNDPSLTERKRKVDDVIQKIAIFTLGLLCGAAIAICVIAGSKVLLEGALAISAVVGIIRCSRSIIREIGSLIATADSTLSILLDEI